MLQLASPIQLEFKNLTAGLQIVSRLKQEEEKLL